MSSSSSIITNTDSYAHVNYERKNIFLRNPEYVRETFDETTGSDQTIEAGQLLGRVASSGKMVKQDPSVADGSQFVAGVAAEDIDVAANGEKDLQVCISGEINENKVILKGSNTLATVIGGGGTNSYDYTKTIRDSLRADTKGIRLRVVEDLSAPDNT